jgi:hypothetical protein
MSTAETTNALSTADLEPTVDSNKEEHAAENETKPSEVADAPTSPSSAEPSCVPAVEDSSKPSPADDTKVDEVGPTETNTSSSVESENAEKVTISPAKDEVNEEVVNKGTKNLFFKICRFLAKYLPPKFPANRDGCFSREGRGRPEFPCHSVQGW